jgi:TonB family protein
LAASAPVAAETSSAAQDARNQWMQSVVTAYYPKRALANREQGSVGFRIKIDSSGQTTECEVTKSSGFPLLDKETCDLITLRAVFKRPEGVSGSQLSTYEGVVTWTLPNSVAISGTAPSKSMANAAPVEKKVCKKVARTGSLVASDRVCMTATQWKRQTDESKELWEGLQGKAGSSHGN